MLDAANFGGQKWNPSKMTDNQSDISIQMSSTNGLPSRKQSSQDPSVSRGTIVTFHNICYRVEVKSGFICCRKTADKEILKDIKLLDILAARKDPHGLSGDVLINGTPQPANFKCISGYVVQDDVVMGTLTVRENLQFSAALRLPTSVKEQEKEERIDQIIKELGLTKVADSKVGTQFIRGVSGGERKRTNIGMELITDPAVLFLDEPTTGLDASTANAVLLLLKRMSKQGKTIIFSIHQPRYSIFRLFDNLTLLAAGRMLYHGPAQNAIEYFKSIGYECEPYNNPADFFLDVINGDSTAVAASKADDVDLDNIEEHINRDKTLAENIAEHYSSSTYYRETKATLQNISLENKKKVKTIFRQVTYTTSFFHQLKWVLKRTFKNLIGNPQASIAQLCVTLFLGLVVGAIFFGIKDDFTGVQNRIGAMFFVTTNQCFSSISSIELFIVEKKIFIHEYISGYYRVSAYFISKLMADLIPMRTLPSIIFTCLKPRADAFFIMMFTIMMVSYTATAMALAIATGQDVVAVANLLMTITFVFMIIFSGLLVNLTSILSWLSWLQYLSIPRYGMTALQINEFTDLKLCTGITNTSQTDMNCTEVSQPGIMRPGLNAILGPTGSGKSSLLDILAARKDPHGLSGEILINGAPRPANFKCISGYVVQNDVVMGTLTVRENFEFSAALRLPSTVAEQEKKERVNQIIRELDLAKVADSKVGTLFIRGVSGGERKRTNIGMELITDPAVLFLDEPTTGLDASTANAVLLLLKRMSSQGKTIIFSLHQPRYSIFRLFDSLTLLAAGSLLYHGPAQNALQYFKSIGYECEPYNNPADFFLDIINGDSTAVTLSKSESVSQCNLSETIEEVGGDKTIAEKLAELFSSSPYYKETKAELERLSLENKRKMSADFQQITYSTSFFHQLKWVSRRTFKNLIYNPQSSMAQLCITTGLGVVVGAIFSGIKNDSSGIQNSFGFKPTIGAFFIMMVTLILVAHTASSMALAIATGQDIVTVANLLINICFVFMIIFSGLLVNLTSIESWLVWLNYFSIPRYGLTALQINEFTGLNFCQNANVTGVNVSCITSSPFTICTGEEYLKMQGIEVSAWGMWRNYVALLCMTLIFLTIAYLKLRFLKKFS
ncbi:ATP-binding cassette sub-family G member 2 [Chelonia mydas]|uniref:Broad substrate specificity ATP-binding cassette transporter ABCG2 n=1 Tax=Chelonia mydas TaxID=8469 RepID=M7B1Q8_CHEMY|nr:ATP-binding cassette sub-family G member 2 [Chelonia mydas]